MHNWGNKTQSSSGIRGKHKTVRESTGGRKEGSYKQMAFSILSALWCVCVLLFVGGSRVSGLQCPVSRHFDAKQQNHRYPTLFYPKVQQKSFAVYNCNIDYAIASKNLSLCDRDVNLCPVNDFFKYLGKETNVNIFYFGGSMTFGSETHCRCRCKDTEDRRCPPTFCAARLAKPVLQLAVSHLPLVKSLIPYYYLPFLCRSMRCYILIS